MLSADAILSILAQATEPLTLVELASAAEITPITVRRHAPSLEASGLIQVERRGVGRASLYRRVFPSIKEASQPGSFVRPVTSPAANHLPDRATASVPTWIIRETPHEWPPNLLRFPALAEPLAATGTDGPSSYARRAHALDPFRFPGSSLGSDQPTAIDGANGSDLPVAVGALSLNNRLAGEINPGQRPPRDGGQSGEPPAMDDQPGPRAARARKTPDALDDLLDLGLDYGDAADLLARYDAVYIADKVTLVRGLMVRQSPLVEPSVAGYLRRAIERDYRPRLRPLPEQAQAPPTPAVLREPDPEADELWQAAQPVIKAQFSRMNSQIVLRDARLLRLTTATAILAPRPGMAGGCHTLLEPLGRILSGLAGRPLSVVLVEPT